MTREKLELQIHLLQDEVLSMGSMVETALHTSVMTLVRRDTQMAHTVFYQDQFINEKKFAIENHILVLMATQQPIARDLRLMAAMLEIISELERMGDYAKGICKITWQLEDRLVPIPASRFEEMESIVANMLHRCLVAFTQEDARQAAIIAARDDEVDAMYNDIYHHIVQAMLKQPDQIDTTNLLLWVAHNLERAADRVTNICERIVYIATGDLLEFDSSEDSELEDSIPS
jgi:phosphate transport system protein